MSPTRTATKSASPSRLVSHSQVLFEGNFNSAQAIDYARALLQHCGVNPADVFVQTSQ